MDRSDAADARRFRWLLEGNGYYMEENFLCGHPPTDDKERDAARSSIDEAMAYDPTQTPVGKPGSR